MDDLFGPSSSTNDSKPSTPLPNLAPETSPIDGMPEEHSEEPDRMKQWRREFKERLEKKDAEEAIKIKEMSEQAEKDLEEWYEKRKDQIEKKYQMNLMEQQDFIKSNKKSNSEGIDWKDVAKFCEFNPKLGKSEKDSSRLRSLLLNLKDEPVATQ
ncbi:hypothetical protein SNEBB_005997 [Seison nebaliae]|nr:hypothetical protein SNEBB_005997 [Seison nebaliae]